MFYPIFLQGSQGDQGKAGQSGANGRTVSKTEHDYILVFCVSG
jgi:hypothetical protein